MIINGLQKLTLLDYPGHTACTVFLGGCNVRCPFCHNAVLVIDAGNQPTVSEEEFFKFLDKRHGLLDGVAITGGEPTMRSDLPEFIAKIKDKGFDVKLDTNGCYPEVLEKLLSDKNVDYVAMDIKSSPESYAKTVGIDSFDLAPVRKSVDLLMKGNTPFEFRTTVVKELHTLEDIVSIGKWIQGAPQYFLQLFKDNGGNLQSGLNPWDEKTMHAFLEAVKPYVCHAAVRGMD